MLRNKYKKLCKTEDEMCMKRRFKAISLLLAASLVLPVGMTYKNDLSIVKADDLDDAKEEKEKAEEKKKEAEEKLEGLNKSADETTSDIEELDNQIGACRTKIQGLNDKKNEIQAQLAVTEMKLQNAYIMEKNQYESMKKRMQYAYENGDIDYIQALIEIENFDGFVNQSEYVEQVSIFDQEQLNKLMAIKQEIATGEEEMQKKLKDIKEIKAENEAEQEELKGLQDEKKEKLKEYESQISETNDLIYDLDADIEAKTSEIAALQAEVEKKRQEVAEARAKAAESGDDTYIPEIKGDGTICCWPCPSCHDISSHYGPRYVEGCPEASTFHNAIDISGDYGAEIVAAGDGYVSQIEYNDIRGKYIIVDHGNGLCTLYQHMSGYAVSVGDNVSAGQVIGYVGETGIGTGPHLHFEVWENFNPVNPELYIQP